MNKLLIGLVLMTFLACRENKPQEEKKEEVKAGLVQAVNRPRQLHVGRTIVSAIAGALQRSLLGEFRLPVTQDMLRDAELG